MSFTGPQGTPASSRRSSHPATEPPAKEAESSASRSAWCSVRAALSAKRASSTSSGRPRTWHRRSKSRSLPAATTTQPSVAAKNWKGVIAGCRDPSGPGTCPGHVVAGDGVLQEGHLAVEHGDVQVPASAGLPGSRQGREQPDAGEEGRAQVRRRRADPDRGLARQARDRGEAAHGLDDYVVRRPVGVRPALAEAGDRRVHEAGIAGRDTAVVEAESAPCCRDGSSPPGCRTVPRDPWPAGSRGACAGLGLPTSCRG